MRKLTVLIVIIFCLAPLSIHAGETPRRIISLAPNMTEVLFALGLGDRIVGVTNFCDYPEEARHKRKVGGMSNPSLEAVVSLKPDIVVMTTDGNPKEFAERLRSLKIRTYISKERRLRDLPDAVREVGAALGVRDRAEALAGDMEARLRKLDAERTPGPKKKMLFIVWPEPLIAAGPGTVIDDAIAVAGAENVASRAKSEYPKYSIEAILQNPPDLIVIGKGMTNITKLSQGLLDRVKILPAVREKRIYYVSDDLYRLGPRTVRGIEELKAVLER